MQKSKLKNCIYLLIFIYIFNLFVVHYSLSFKKDSSLSNINNEQYISSLQKIYIIDINQTNRKIEFFNINHNQTRNANTKLVLQLILIIFIALYLIIDRLMLLKRISTIRFNGSKYKESAHLL